MKQKSTESVQRLKQAALRAAGMTVLVRALGAAMLAWAAFRERTPFVFEVAMLLLAAVCLLNIPFALMDLWKRFQMAKKKEEEADGD